MSSTGPFVRLLRATGDRLGEVLDSYKQFYPHVLSSDYHQVIKNVKALLELVQLLENEYLIRPFRATIPRAETNIAQVLKDCGELSKLLRIQIEGRRLRDDVSTSQDIERYYNEVESFRDSYGRSRDEPTARASRAEQAELEDLSAYPSIWQSTCFANSYHPA